jgi:GGDEF domain-containing protein
LCIDIENFKHFVDVHGRTASNEALLAIADHLTSTYVDKNIYRFGGDEFIVDLKSESPGQLSSVDNGIVLKYTTVQVYAEPNQHRTNYMVRAIYHQLEKGIIISNTEGNTLLCELTW